MKILIQIALFSIIAIQCKNTNPFEGQTAILTENRTTDNCRKVLLSSILTPRKLNDGLKIEKCNRRLNKIESTGLSNDSIFSIEIGESISFSDRHFHIKYSLKSIIKTKAVFEYKLNAQHPGSDRGEIDEGELNISIIKDGEESYLTYLDRKVTEQLADEHIALGNIFILDTMLSPYGYEGELNARKECIDTFMKTNEFSIHVAYGCKLTDYNRMQLSDFNSKVFEHLKLDMFSFDLLENLKKEFYNCDF